MSEYDDNRVSHPFGESSTSRWIEIPPELLQMIFLMFEKDSAKKCLLNCRLVHRHWKKSSEKILEMKCLEAWNWKPSSSSAPFPLPNNVSLFNLSEQLVVYHRQLVSSAEGEGFGFTNFPALQVNKTLDKTMLEWALCHPISSTGTNADKLCSIPTAFLRLQFNEDHVADDRLIKIPVTLFSTYYGQSLTCIELINLSVNTLVLQSIFQTLTSVKAMTITNIYLKRDFSEDRLNTLALTLPMLRHLKLTLARRNHDDDYDSYRWLLSSFVGKLISLETDGQLFTYLEKAEIHSDSTEFSKLKELSVTDVPNVYPGHVTVANFPKLEKVSLSLLFDDSSVLVWEKLMNVLRFLKTSAKTLSHLHLEFKRWTRQRIDLNLVPEETPFNFPKMTTLGIFYPMVAGEKKILQRFFKVAPNLKTLKLFRFIRQSTRKWHHELNGLQLETDSRSFKKVCPQIKKLTTYLRWDEESEFYTLRF